MTKIITVTNSKGGVGKTTTAIFLATLLSKKGRVLLKDADPQGSATEWLDDLEEVVFDYEIANIRSLSKTKNYDFVIIDTPPQNADIIKESINVADFVLIPSSPSGLEISRVFSIVEEIRDYKKYGVLLVQSDNRTNSFKMVKELLNIEEINLFKTSIPKRECIKQAFHLIPTKKEQLQEYQEVATELLEVL